MSSNVSPTAARERIEILDVLRGLAVFGIILGNIQWFSGYGRMPIFLLHETPIVDQVVHFLVNLFVDGKFYSIFSILFGFGFALQITRPADRGDTTGRVFKRRLFWLLVFGLLHAYLIWGGDILTVYAALGFVLFFFRNSTTGSLLKWATTLTLLPVFVYTAYYVFTSIFLGTPGRAPADAARKTESWNQMIATVAYGGYWDIVTGYNWRYALGRYEGLITDMRLPKVLAMFLLGFYVYRRGLLRNVSLKKAFWRKVLIYGGSIGLVANAILAALMWRGGAFNPPSVLGVLGTAAYAAGVPAFAAAYIAGAVLVWEKVGGRRLLTPLAAVGRMALTNYILQSIICVLIFYGYGLGLFGQAGAAAATIAAVGIFAFQVVFSNLWMTFFLYGPLEWVWRQLTYGKRLRIAAWSSRDEGKAPTIQDAQTGAAMGKRAV